ncbi:MAG: flagellar export protein FliJ [Methylophaga sp.]|nr:MAG: flagellar export protein FliJ [Methylophaga sp.]
MKRSKRLAPVVNIATKATDSALIKMGEANAAWLKEKQQLEELHLYKGEYLARFRQGNTKVMSAQKVLELRGFLVQLDQAIQVQEQQVHVYLQQLEQQRTLWQQTRNKEQAMQGLVERYHQEEAQLESKQEQQASDEHNAIQWRHRFK